MATLDMIHALGIGRWPVAMNGSPSSRSAGVLDDRQSTFGAGVETFDCSIFEFRRDDYLLGNNIALVVQLEQFWCLRGTTRVTLALPLIDLDSQSHGSESSLVTSPDHLPR
jgi:hypothetical protein